MTESEIRRVPDPIHEPLPILEQARETAANLKAFLYRMETLSTFADLQTEKYEVELHKRGFVGPLHHQHLKAQMRDFAFDVYDHLDSPDKSEVRFPFSASYRPLVDSLRTHKEEIVQTEEKMKVSSSEMSQKDRINIALKAIWKLQFGSLPGSEKEKLIRIANFPEDVRAKLIKSWVVTGVTVWLSEGSIGAATGLGLSSNFIQSYPDYEKILMLLSAYAVNILATKHNRDTNRDAILKTGYCSNAFATVAYHILRSVVPDREDLQMRSIDLVSFLPPLLEVPASFISFQLGNPGVSAIILRNYVSAFFQVLAGDVFNGAIINEGRISDFFKSHLPHHATIFQRKKK